LSKLRRVSADSVAARKTSSSRGGAPTVSVIVCAYTEHRWQALLQSVESIVRQTYPVHETLVVVDHNPGLLKQAREKLPSARVITNTGTPGLSGARNSGVAASSGQIIAFLDDDAIAAPNWLAELVAAFSDPHVLGAGGVATPRWDSGTPSWLPEEFYWTVGCSYRGLPSKTSPVRNPIGANMSFRRSVLERIDGFKDGLGRLGTTPLGCEETELSIRAQNAYPGGVLLHVPTAVVEHNVTVERASWRYFRRRCWSEGLSKARVIEAVGSRDGLSSERTYALITLPTGFFRGLHDSLRGDPDGLRRSGAIVLGMLLTVSGYLRGRYARQ
jgi:glycosyltransferase involved in cell wall biosynthesis